MQDNRNTIDQSCVALLFLKSVETDYLTVTKSLQNLPSHQWNKIPSDKGCGTHCHTCNLTDINTSVNRIMV